ncbi:MAG: hypothetical protein J6U22_00510 [Bacteroidaceae bacterium]|nr:hypothetical protein [Bacteroidaceae bacterium]
MKYSVLFATVLTVLITATISVSAQRPNGEVITYETAYNRVFVVGDTQGIHKLNGDTLVGNKPYSLTAVLMDTDGNPLRTETYTDHELSIAGETVKWTKGKYPQTAVFDMKVKEPVEWTDYIYQDGKKISETTNGNSPLTQTNNIRYEYNNDGSIKTKISSTGMSGITERMDYYSRNGRIDSIEIICFNQLGVEVTATYSKVHGASASSTTVSWEPASTAVKREKRYYRYSPDGSYRIFFKNDGTGKTEYYDSRDMLLRTVMPDGKEYRNLYNTQGDPLMIHIVERFNVRSTRYDSYLYDDHNNWSFRRVFESDNDGYLIPDRVENRRYCYRDGESYESFAFKTEHKLEPWYIYYDMNGGLMIQHSKLFPGEEQHDIDEAVLNRLRSLPGIKIDETGKITIEGHHAVIIRINMEN